MLNVILCSSLQEPLQASQASAAAVLTILSPTSSPWGALPSPWPHPWSSPATPCITAVKTKTSQRPLRPPHPRMTRNPWPLPVEPLSPQPTIHPWLTRQPQPKPIYQNQCCAGTSSPCWSPRSTLFRSSLYERLNALISVQTLVLTDETSRSSPWIDWDCKRAQPRCTAVIIYPLPPSTRISIPPPFFFFYNVSWWHLFNPSVPENPLVARYQH